MLTASCCEEGVDKGRAHEHPSEENLPRRSVHWECSISSSTYLCIYVEIFSRGLSDAGVIYVRGLSLSLLYTRGKREREG